LDDATGSTAKDVSTNGLNGVYHGGVTSTSGCLSGNYNNAALFDGYTGYITFGTPLKLSFPYDQFTFEFWANFNGYTAGVLHKGGDLGQPNSWEYHINTVASDCILHFTTNTLTGQIITSFQFQYTPWEWHHYVWTQDGINAYLYVDAVLIAQQAIPTNITTGIGQSGLEIGRSIGPILDQMTYMNGVLDEVALYNYALTKNQIIIHYTNRTYTLSRSASQLASYLPPDIVGSSPMFIRLWIAYGEEFGSVAASLNSLSRQFFATSSTWALDDWERDFSLSNGDDIFTNIIRQGRLLSAMKASGMPTQQSMTDLAKSYQFGNAIFIEDFSNYTVYVKFAGTEGIPPNVEILQNQIAAAMPAHLFIVYQYEYLTWDQLDAHNYLWNELDAFNYTWDEFEVTS
jgi:hypothetical protein